jgi:hypothetical protein
MPCPSRAPTRLLVAAILTVALPLGACAANRPAKEPSEYSSWEGRGRECVRPFVNRASAYSDGVGTAESDVPALASVPPEAGRTVRAARISRMVARALAGAAASEKPTIEHLITRQELGMRLISLETQVAAMIFEAECTGELIEAMTFELEDRSDLRDLRLALGSLVVGAISATVAGIWDLRAGDSKGPAVLGLSGGIGSAALGGAAFIKHPQSMQYIHPRNLLAPVVAGVDTDELYPRFVFSLLVLSAAEGGPSPRERLLVRWRELIEEAVPRSDRKAAEQLLYGDGGVYSQELLALRERMYDTLETELNAQARDLELLDRFLVRALERTEPP